MEFDKQVVSDFAEAEKWIWSAITYYRAGNPKALTDLLMSLEPGERMAFEVRLVSMITGSIVNAFGDEGAREYIAQALYKAHKEPTS